MESRHRLYRRPECAVERGLGPEKTETGRRGRKTFEGPERKGRPNEFGEAVQSGPGRSIGVAKCEHNRFHFLLKNILYFSIAVQMELIIYQLCRPSEEGPKLIHIFFRYPDILSDIKHNLDIFFGYRI